MSGFRQAPLYTTCPQWGGKQDVDRRSNGTVNPPLQNSYPRELLKVLPAVRCSRSVRQRAVLEQG